MKNALLAFNCGLALALWVGWALWVFGHRPKPAPMAVGVASALTVAAWWVDPANATTCASDGNTCQSATCGAANSGNGPCLTFGSIVSRWGTNTPLLPQTTTITFLSDQTPGTDLVNVQPQMVNGNQFLLINGALLQQTTATIGTFTARNRTAGTPNKITAQGQSGSYWSTFVGDLVVDTTQTPNGYFWVEADLGTATAQITEPVPNPATGVQFPIIVSYVTPANGDSLTIYRPSKINCYRVGADLLFSTTVVQNATCTGVGNTTSFSTFGSTSTANVHFDGNETLDQCSQQPISQRGYYMNNYVEGLGPTLAGFWVSGAVKPVTALTIGCTWNDQRAALDGDILVDPGVPFHATTTTSFGRVYFGTNTLLDTDSGGLWQIGLFDTAGIFFADSELWGPGKIDMHDRADLICNGGCTTQLLLTGGITMQNGGQNTAFPWNSSTRTWGTAVTISGPAIDDAGALCDPGRGNCYRNKY